jgi:hypothetical protein
MARLASAQYQSLGNEPARPKHLALADQLSILVADANSQNHLHARGWAM